MRLFNKFLILILAFSLASCIELEEKITVYSDKSGDYSLGVDLGMLSGVAGDKIPAEVVNFPQIVGKEITGVSGISNIKTENSDGKYFVSFRFKNQKSFKKAMLKLAAIKYDFAVPNYIKIRKHSIKKRDIHSLISKTVSSLDGDLLNQSFMGQSLSSMITVKSTITTPSKVKRTRKNVNAIVEDNNKVVVKGKLEDILGGMNTGVVVKY